MYYVNENIKNLYRSKFHDKRNNVLRLDMNESPTGLPKEFVENVKKQIIPSYLAAYPEKDELIELIARHNKIKTEEITLTSGSDEAMRLVFQCFGQKDKELLTVYPTFEMYDIYSKMFGMRHVTVEYTESFEISIEDVLSKITSQTRIIVLLNPNSPIGTVYRKADFYKIMEEAQRIGAIVVVDEAYHYFCKTTFMPEIEIYHNLIILRTFSKLCSIAGLRVGYGVANETIIRYIENSQSTFNVNSVGILFAKELLKNEKLICELIEQERVGHQWLIRQITEAGYPYYSNQGNYILVYPKSESRKLVEALKNKNVWVRDYEKGILKGWIRVSTGDISCMKKFWSTFLDCDGKI